ncbi:L,D-transpeptidase family protein [Photobacterium indicum]|nr:L,D-transpeptidase family protein [Photobacterium indicum]
MYCIARIMDGMDVLKHKAIFTALLTMATTLVQANWDYPDSPKKGYRTINDVVKHYSPILEPRISLMFEQVGVQYPPEQIAMFALKEEMQVELWAKDEESWVYIKRYDIAKISGKSGPKLREGDHQVPEGIYQVIGLNPNSKYHLSMQLNYPNEFDLKYAQLEKRNRPGSNIFIHGKAKSVGCLAMGDIAIEELFLLVERAQIQNVQVVISPSDPRKGPLVPRHGQPFWVMQLYRNIEKEAQKFGR